MLNPSSVTKRKNTSYLKVVRDTDEPEKQPKSGLYFFLFLIIVGILGGYYLFSGSKKSPIVVDEAGNISLAPHRQKKLDKELEEIDNAVQYALIATENGIYPCYTCADAGFTIYLHIGEVWKYGMTRIGDKRRYPKGDYGADKVVFVEQFYGTYSECLKMEKIKLYGYPLLLEARKRTFLLVLPPGNAKAN